MVDSIFLRKISLVDYPGKVAAVLFLPGCKLRCPWCHNRELVLGGEPQGAVSLDAALAHIKKRRSVLGGVVLSGGEPTLYRDLPGLIRRIKGLGLPVKLDTNGMAPDMLETLFSQEELRPDYLALDLKRSPRRYGSLTRAIPDPGDRLEASAALIRASGIAHEFRSLVFPNRFFTGDDVRDLAPLADNADELSAAPWYFRVFMPGNCLDPNWNELEPGSKEEATALARKARDLGKNAVAP
jgi:pyruvate formate lyase activating enzyme